MTERRDPDGIIREISRSPYSTPTHGVDRHPLKYVCLAGNIREYYQWMRRHDIKEGEAMYASTPSVLHGLPHESGITFHQVGTFELRKDALKILEVVRGSHPTAAIYLDR